MLIISRVVISNDILSVMNHSVKAQPQMSLSITCHLSSDIPHFGV